MACVRTTAAPAIRNPRTETPTGHRRCGRSTSCRRAARRCGSSTCASHGTSRSSQRRLVSALFHDTLVGWCCVAHAPAWAGSRRGPIMNFPSQRRRHIDALIAVSLFASLAACSNSSGLPHSGQTGIAESSMSATTFQAAAGTKNVLFVSDLLTNVTAFPAGIHKINPQSLETITNGTTRPEGMWVDGHGTLYVVNGVNGRVPVNVAEYKLGKTSPDRLLQKGLTAPTAVAVGPDGTVYVNDAQQTVTGVVVVYARGQMNPERTITLPDPAYALQPGGMAFDT